MLGSKKDYSYAGIEPREYSEVEISKFIRFTNLLNEKFEYRLEMANMINLQLQRNARAQERIEKEITDVEQRINKIHFDTISIISIFVAIIFALYGGVNLGNSLINKIDPEDYRLLVKIGLIIGYILVALVSIIVTSLSMYDNKKNKKWVILAINLMFAAVAVIAIKIL